MPLLMCFKKIIHIDKCLQNEIQGREKILKQSCLLSSAKIGYFFSFTMEHKYEKSLTENYFVRTSRGIQIVKQIQHKKQYRNATNE